jgi:hypothetical protein
MHLETQTFLARRDQPMHHQIHPEGDQHHPHHRQKRSGGCPLQVKNRQGGLSGKNGQNSGLSVHPLPIQPEEHGRKQNREAAEGCGGDLQQGRRRLIGKSQSGQAEANDEEPTRPAGGDRLPAQQREDVAGEDRAQGQQLRVHGGHESGQAGGNDQRPHGVSRDGRRHHGQDAVGLLSGKIREKEMAQNADCNRPKKDKGADERVPEHHAAQRAFIAGCEKTLEQLGEHGVAKKP